MPATWTLEPITITGDSNHTACTRLGGFSIRSGVSAAVVNLRHGSVSGQILAVANIPAASTQTTILDGHISAPSGVYVEGAVTGVLYDLE